MNFFKNPNKMQLYIVHKKLALNINTQLKSKEIEKIYTKLKLIKRKLEDYKISDKANFSTGNIISDKEGRI